MPTFSLTVKAEQLPPTYQVAEKPYGSWWEKAINYVPGLSCWAISEHLGEEILGGFQEAI